MTDQIYFVPNSYSFTGNNFPTCSHADFLCKLENHLPVYEVITDNTKAKYYFDFDYYVEPKEFSLDVANEINRILTTRLIDALNSVSDIEPNIHVLQAHKENIGDGRGKYSIRYYISNMISTKQCIKDFAIDTNKYFDKQETELWDYIEKPKDTFDLTIYDKNRKMRCYQTSKPNENRPLLLENGTIAGTIITGCFDKDAKEINYVSIFKTEKPKASILPVSSGLPNFNKISELGEIIDLKYLNVSGCYSDWCKIIWSLRSESEDYKEIANNISKRGTKLYDEASFEKTWDAFKPSTLTIKSFYHYCKDSDETEFRRICGKYMDKSIIDQSNMDCYVTDIDTIMDLYKCSNLISKTLKDSVVLCNESWFVLQSNNLWKQVKEPTFQITTEIRKYIDYSNEKLVKEIRDCSGAEKDKKIEQSKMFLSYYKEINKSSYMSQLIKNLKGQIRDDEFEDKLDINKFKIAYKNGMLDLKTLEFKYGILSSDFISKTIPYDYEKACDSDISEIRSELLKICNNNEIHLNYYLSTLGYSMTGDSSKLQEFYYILGQKASNGKSVIFDALQNIISTYIVKVENNTFEPRNKDIHKEIASWRGARIAWVNELTKNKQDAELIKEIADGTTRKYKVMYGTSTEMSINFKLFIVSNHSPSIDSDNGIARRMRMFQMDSEFIDGLENDDYEKCLFKKDTNFGDLLKTKYKFALMDLIYSYSKKYVDNDFKLEPYPVEWKEQTTECVSSNNEFKEFFETHFETGDNKSISLFKLNQILKAYGNVKFNDENKKNKWGFEYERNKKLWSGFCAKDVIDKD